jgi:trans-aconitate methyltransferase
MPGSLADFDTVFINHITQLNPNSFLDVGCGEGNYGNLVRNTLPNITHLHAVEPTDVYIENYQLNAKYDRVYNCPVQDFLKQEIDLIYDIAYCSDMLEHLFLSEAIDTIDSLLYCSRWVIAKWPTNVSQGWWEGNYYEKHKSNIKLADLQRFNIHYYAKVTPDPGVEYHYCVISGFHTNQTLRV